MLVERGASTESPDELLKILTQQNADQNETPEIKKIKKEMIDYLVSKNVIDPNKNTNSKNEIPDLERQADGLSGSNSTEVNNSGNGNVQIGDNNTIIINPDLAAAQRLLFRTILKNAYNDLGANVIGHVGNHAHPFHINHLESLVNDTYCSENYPEIHSKASSVLHEARAANSPGGNKRKTPNDIKDQMSLLMQLIFEQNPEGVKLSNPMKRPGAIG
jgi:hypothetical protein